ncbi:MAG: hypothetical protein C4278_02105 [Patescibacteria group bacterium]
MKLDKKEKRRLIRFLIFGGGFLVIFIANILLLNFYSQKIISLTKEIQNQKQVKESILNENQKLKIYSNLINNLEKEYNFNFQGFINLLKTKESVNLKDLLEKESKNNNWTLKQISEKEFEITLSKNDLKNFLSILNKELIILKLKGLVIRPEGENYKINLIII